MDATLTLWTVILVVGALNYGSRLSFIAFFARRDMPPLLARALRYVPAAMLTALIVPMILPAPGVHVPLALTPKIVAALVAAVVAWFTRSTLKTLATGMVSLWLLELAYSRIG
jgi:branched-subunit amino acid transport protein